jgi:signal transduction histidine kinase
MTDQGKIVRAGHEFLPLPSVAFEDLAQGSSLRQLFSSVLHELHQPLVAIRLFAENGRAICEDEAISADKLRSLFEDVGKSADLAIRTIGRLRSFVKGQAPTFNPTDVNDAITEALQVAEIVASSRGIAIIKHFEPGLAAVWADCGALQEAFLNLVFNAIEAIDDEDERTISVSTRSVGDGLEVVVADTGCGIAEEHRNKLFEPEFTTKPQGSGLGLGIVREIIGQHGGSISLLPSRPGDGASFCVRLPMDLGSRVSAQVEALPQAAARQSRRCRSHEQPHGAPVNRCAA